MNTKLVGSSSLKQEFEEDFNDKACRKPDLLSYALEYTDFMDTSSSIDTERLRLWCQAHWQVTFRTAQLHSNSMVYHSCCNSFSRRHFNKSAGHPDHLSIRLNRIQSFKNIETEESLFFWLLCIAKDRARRGLKTAFPTINRKHNELAEQDPVLQAREAEGCYLKKRCEDLDNEVRKLRDQNEYFKDQNSKLLNSCTDWHNKYQELREQREYLASYLSTPQKKLSKDEVFLEDN